MYKYFASPKWKTCRRPWTVRWMSVQMMLQHSYLYIHIIYIHIHSYSYFKFCSQNGHAYECLSMCEDFLPMLFWQHGYIATVKFSLIPMLFWHYEYTATVKFRLQLQPLIGLLRLRVGFVLAVIESFKTASDCPFHQMISMHVRKGNLWISENKDLTIPLMPWQFKGRLKHQTHMDFSNLKPFSLHCLTSTLYMCLIKNHGLEVQIKA